MNGIEQLLKQYNHWLRTAYDKLKTQAAYNDFLRKEVLTKARDDFRLPAPLYAFSLVGIDISYRTCDDGPHCI
jgi:hypothetical protein